MSTNDENEPVVSDRVLQKRKAAAASRADKRQRMGEEAFLREKREAKQQLKQRRKAERDAAAPQPASASPTVAAAHVVDPAIDVASQLAMVAELWTQGALTDDEFSAAKGKMLASRPQHVPAHPAPPLAVHRCTGFTYVCPGPA